MRSFFLTTACAVIPIFCNAAYTIKNGKLIATHELATLSVQEHYGLAKDALEGGNWIELIRQSRIISKNFSGTAFAEDAHFYMGLAYFHLKELDLSNNHFSVYIKELSAPKFFEEAIRYKFLIAQEFERGAKRRFLGQEGMPKWMSGRRECIDIYDEVIAALPQHDLAVQSLYGKGSVLFAEEDFKAAIETFQILLRRFPKNSLAGDSYVAITQVYKAMSEKEYADPDFLDLAAINVKKFKMDFPGDPKIAEAEEVLNAMMEVYALDLYETAEFYERTKKPKASIIYYSKITAKYPGTRIAAKSQDKLNALLKVHGPKEEMPTLPKKVESVIVDGSSLDSEPVR